MKKFIAKLHYLTQDLDSRSHIDQAQNACEAGSKWIQYRCLSKNDDELLEDLHQIASICDNATLAAQGVPAHTISTVQIDKDEYYHTVDDELETLNVDNIAATIKAIALSSRSIVAGTETPARIPLR